MINFKTIKTIASIVGTASAAFGAVSAINKAKNMVPKKTRQKISGTVKNFREKSKNGMVNVLEKTMPGVVDEILERNAEQNESKTQDDIAEMKKLMEKMVGQTEKKKKTVKEKQPVAKK